MLLVISFPWTVSQQFQDTTFPSLAGARIIRIATNPQYQGMGYGSVAMKLLEKYYSGQIEAEAQLKANVLSETRALDTAASSSNGSLEIAVNDPKPKKSLPPLLFKTR